MSTTISEATSKVTAYLSSTRSTPTNSTSPTFAYTVSKPPSVPLDSIVLLTNPLPELLVTAPEAPEEMVYMLGDDMTRGYFTSGTFNTTSEELSDDHVILEVVKFSEPADVALGCLVIILSIIALTGNSWSATYFLEKNKKSIHFLLYSLMSIVDIISSLIAIPVITTLLSSREPVMFNNGPFCLIWTVLFYYILRISIFLVLLVTVTRTMGMTFPVHRVRPKRVLIALAVYSGIIILVDVVFLAVGLLEMDYRQQEGFCEMFEPMKLKLENYQAAKIYTVLLKLELILPSILVFVSFIVGTVLLFRQMENRRKMKKDESELRYASVTVALFTIIFLICNLPCFFIQLVYFMSLFRDMSFLRGNESFRHYGHLVSVFLLPLLNSALNPCLYLTRMPQYRRWSSAKSIEIKINGKTFTLLSAKSQSSVV